MAVSFARDFSFDESFIKMNDLFNQKKYSKALKLAMKVKKEDLTAEQKDLLKQFMETAVIKKQMDDAIKTFSVRYDQYENFYVYSPTFIYAPSITPYIYSFENHTIYKLKFNGYYHSRTRMSPNLVILNSDGKNLIFKPFSGDDVLLNYNTRERRVTAWVNLSDKEVYSVVKAMNGRNVSFKIKDTETSKEVVSQVFASEKEKIKNGFWLYASLRDKLLEPGKNRF